MFFSPVQFSITSAGVMRMQQRKSVRGPAILPVRMNLLTECQMVIIHISEQGGSNVSGGAKAASLYCKSPS